MVHVVVRKLLFGRVTPVGLSEEDLVQEGMIALLVADRTFKEDMGAKFETYASRCIHNRVVDVIRRAKRAPESAGDREQDVGERGQIEDDFEREEILKNVLSECNEIERAIFNSYFQGYSYTEIANIFEVPQKKIDNTIQKIKNKVKIAVE